MSPVFLVAPVASPGNLQDDQQERKLSGGYQAMVSRRGLAAKHKCETAIRGTANAVRPFEYLARAERHYRFSPGPAQKATKTAAETIEALDKWRRLGDGRAGSSPGTLIERGLGQGY